MHCGIWDPTMHWNIDSSWICFSIGPEDDLIKVETWICFSIGPEDDLIKVETWICFSIGPEDDLIKVETCRPDNILLLLYIK